MTQLDSPDASGTTPAWSPGRGDFWLRRQLGFDLEVSRGSAVATLEADERHLNPNGVVHGAVIFAMVDTAMGGATMSVIPRSAKCATIEIQQRFLAPAYSGPLRAEVTVVRAGRRVVHLEATVTNGGDEPVAMATGSFAVIGPSADAQ